MNTAVTGASVLDPGRKWWTLTPAAVAERIVLVEQRAAEHADRHVAARIADAVAAERDAEYGRLIPLLARRTLPAYVAAAVPGWARARYEQEHG